MLQIQNHLSIHLLTLCFTAITAGGPPAAHMLQFAPLFYPYQLAMAQAASGKSGNLTEMQKAELRRATEMQRQYLLDMIPPQSGQRHNWKT